jgi:hypothetical protein
MDSTKENWLLRRFLLLLSFAQIENMQGRNQRLCFPHQQSKTKGF